MREATRGGTTYTINTANIGKKPDSTPTEPNSTPNDETAAAEPNSSESGTADTTEEKVAILGHIEQWKAANKVA